jgi:hypothetical protein
LLFGLINSHRFGHCDVLIAMLNLRKLRPGGASRRTYKVYACPYTLDDYFKLQPPEPYDSNQLIEATLMDDAAKSEWVESMARQEQDYLRMMSNFPQ